VRRYLNYAPDEWDDLPWPVKRLHLEGLAAEGVIQIDASVPDPEFGFGPAEPAPEVANLPERPMVIDVDAMRGELEAAMGQASAAPSR